MLRRHFLKAAASVGTGLALISNLGAAKANTQKPSSSPPAGSGRPADACLEIGLSEQDRLRLDQLMSESERIRAELERHNAEAYETTLCELDAALHGVAAPQ
jgi:hypothetical protein